MNRTTENTYPLIHVEFLNLCSILSNSQLLVYFWLKTKYPVLKKSKPINTEKIAKDINVSRRTVQRAIVILKEKKLISTEENKFNTFVKMQSPTSIDELELSQSV